MMLGKDCLPVGTLWLLDEESELVGLGDRLLPGRMSIATTLLSIGAASGASLPSEGPRVTLRVCPAASAISLRVVTVGGWAGKIPALTQLRCSMLKKGFAQPLNRQKSQSK